MSDEFDGLDATEKAGIGAALNRSIHLLDRRFLLLQQRPLLERHLSEMRRKQIEIGPVECLQEPIFALI